MICRFLADEDKKDLCQWKYEGEYSIYNLPSYDNLKKSRTGFMNPEHEKNYRVFENDDGIVGFINLAEKEAEVFIGVGVNPRFLNMGFGTEILLESYKLSKQLYPEKPLYLQVRSWNKRAIKCYQKAGFNICGDAFELETPIGAGTFYRMIKL